MAYIEITEKMIGAATKRLRDEMNSGSVSLDVAMAAALRAAYNAGEIRSDPDSTGVSGKPVVVWLNGDESYTMTVDAAGWTFPGDGVLVRRLSVSSR
jgi:hypothetical protein